MRKNLVSLCLALAIFITAFPVLAFAAETEDSVYSITVGGETFQSDASKSGSGWSYSDGVLTLNNYNGSTVKSSGDLTVHTLNSVLISGIASDNYNSSSCGIVAVGKLVLNAYGFLTVKGAAGGEAIIASNAIINSYEGAEINLYGGKNAVAIKSNDITLKSRNANICGGKNASAVYFAKSFRVNGFTNAAISSGSDSKYAISYLDDAVYYFNDDEQFIEFTDKNSQIFICAKNDFTYGDCNSDGKVNTKDMVLLAQYLVNRDVTINENAADCRYDVSVDIKDAVLLVQYLAKWNVYLG